MPTKTERTPRAGWMLILAAAAILMITMGARQTTGLFVSPINTATGLGIVSISFALAVGQFVWGAAQPAFGAIADKFGAGRVIVAGTLMLALGTALTPFVDAQWSLLLTMGILCAAGAGAGSFSILIGATAKQLPSERRAFAAGFINAGGSLGQFVFAPLMQAIISSAGWVAAMLTMAVTSLLAIPLAWPLRERRRPPYFPPPAAATAPAAAPNSGGPAPLQLGEQLRVALRDPSYLLLHAGFFTCGFHIAFLVTHLPGEVALCNLSAGVSATALALTLLSHQTGAFFGAWLGGLSFATFGDFTWMWYADIALAVAAALVNLPIKEAPVMAKSAPRPIPA